MEKQRRSSLPTWTSPAQGTRYKFSVAQSERMISDGYFEEDDRIELINGEILLMPPVNHTHEALVSKLAFLFRKALGRTAYVWAQQPVVLGGEVGSSRMYRYFGGVTTSTRSTGPRQKTCCWWLRWPIRHLSRSGAAGAPCTPELGSAITGSSTCGRARWKRTHTPTRTPARTGSSGRLVGEDGYHCRSHYASRSPWVTYWATRWKAGHDGTTGARCFDLKPTTSRS